MTIKRYVASKDSTITNAFKQNLLTRATSANMGASDSLEVFSLIGQAARDSMEMSRILAEFPIEQIREDRQNELIPASGSIQFILKLSNAPHPNTLPKNFRLYVNPLSRSWVEGSGIDMENYRDSGPVNWLSASKTESWTKEGGDFYEDQEFYQTFVDGTEDLEVDITDVVEQWISGTLDNNGVIVRVSSSYEEFPFTDDPGEESVYTKKFFARGSEYFYKKPWLEARWDSTVKDDRGRFYLYNPFVPIELNYNTLYIHNKFRGDLYDLPTVGTGSIYVRLYASPNLPLGTPLPLTTGSTLSPTTVSVATGSWVSTGIYKAEIAIDTELSEVYDIWFDENGTAIGYGGKLLIINPDRQQDFTKRHYDIAIKSLKPVYYSKECARLHLFVRPNNWQPNSYTSLTSQQENTIIGDMYYRVFRVADNLDVIPYGTGSQHHTRLSYDINGNYMDLEMSLLEPGYSYGIKFTVYDSGQYFESKETFKFRLEE